MEKYLTLNKAIKATRKLSKGHLNKYKTTGDPFEFMKHEMTWTLYRDLYTENHNKNKPQHTPSPHLLKCASHILNFREAEPDIHNVIIIKRYYGLLTRRRWSNNTLLDQLKFFEDKVGANHTSYIINTYDVIIRKFQSEDLLKYADDEIDQIANKYKLSNMFNMLRYDILPRPEAFKFSNY